MGVDNRAGIAPARLREIEAAVADQGCLQDAVRWALSRTPPRLVSDVIVQDEFTHDVVIPYDEALHLVYDTT